MADTFNTTGSTSLGSTMKDLHGKVVTTVHSASKLQKEYPIDTNATLGRKFLQPVIASNPGGFSFSKANNGAFTLADSVPSVIPEAQVEPAQILLKETVDYESLFRTENGERVAYVPAVKGVMERMVKSTRKETEMQLLYGQSAYGYGVTESSSASTSVVFNTSYFPAGYWAGKKGHFVQIANTAWGGDEDTSDAIVSLDIDTRTLVVTNAQTLDAGDLVTHLGSVVTNATPASVVYHQMAGVHAIIANTGTLFGVSAATYPDVWKGAAVTVSGEPTMGKLLKGVSRLASMGCDVGLIAWCSPDVYERLNDNVSTLRRLDYGYRHSKVESGAESLVFYGQTGRLRIEPHPYMMNYHSLIMPDGESGLVRRLASTDITFKRQGGGGKEDMAVESSGVAGCEIRCYTGQQIFCDMPAWMAEVKGFSLT